MSTTVNVPVSVYYRDPNKSQPSNQMCRNQPQTTALSSASLLFISAGMSMAQSIGWEISTPTMFGVHFHICWFIAVCVGALVAAPLIKFVPKIFCMGISSLLVLISGIIYTSAPYNIDALLAAKYLHGLGIGFLTVSFLMHASEIADYTNRGSCLGLEQYCISIGLAIQVIYSSQWEDISFPSNRLHGILDIILSVLAFGSLYFVIESPVFYLRQGNEDKALETLSQLRRPQGVSNATKALLEEYKTYVRENENLELSVMLAQSGLPLLKVLLYRCMVAFTFSLPLSQVIQFASYFSLESRDNWVLIVYVCLRFLGAFMALYLLDSLGRKLVPILSLLCFGGMILGIAIIFSNDSNYNQSHSMAIVCSLSLLSQFFAGMFILGTSTYMAEALPLLMKPFGMAFCIIVQQLIHIIVISTYIGNIYAYCLSVAVIVMVFSVVFGVLMPETRHTSLNEAQKRFRNLINLRFF